MSPQRIKGQSQKPPREPRAPARADSQPSAETARAWRAVIRNGLI